MGTLRIMGKSGDEEKAWNPENPIEVKGLKEIFEEKTRDGYVAFRTDPQTKQGEKIKAFDPEAHEIILYRQLRGG